MKRPMCIIAAAWLAGLLLAKLQPGYVFLFLFIYVSLIFFCLVLLKYQPYHLDSLVQKEWYPQLTILILLVPCLFFCGYTRMQYEKQERTDAAAPWRSMEAAGEDYVFVRGRVQEKRCEDQIILELTDCEVSGYSNKESQFISAGGCQVMIEAEGQEWLPEVYVGNVIQVYGKFSVYREATNPGQFDAFDYYAGKGLYAGVKAQRVTVLEEKISIIGQAMFLMKQWMRESITSLYPAEKAGVLAAMMLGDKDLLDPEVKALYQQNGISHILAISGLHISMLCMGLFRVLRFVGVSLKGSSFVTTAFLTFYICYTGASTSSLRAGIMCLVLLGAKLLRRSYDLVSSLSLAAILVTALRPMEITSAGFLLSFSAVLGVAIAQEAEHVLKEQQEEAHMRREGVQSQFGAGGLLQKQRAFGMDGKGSTWWSSLLFGGMIQCVTIPISLWFYYELSPYSILLNLIVLPLVSLILGGGLLSALLGLLASMAAELPKVLVSSVWLAAKLPAGGTYLLLELYEWLGEATQKLPFSFVLVGRPEVWQMVLYYGILVAVLKLFFAKPGQKNGVVSGQRGHKLVSGTLDNKQASVRVKHLRTSKWQIMCLAGGVFLALAVLLFPVKDRSKMIFLDVSQGDSMLFRTEEGKVILSDCGSSDSSKVGEYRLTPVLKQAGSMLIDMAVVSHLDTDHMSGIREVLVNMPVYEGKQHFIRNYKGEIGIVELVLPKVLKPSDSYLELVALASEKQVSVRYIEAGEVLYREEGLLLECLSPKNAEVSENDTSLVLLMQTENLVVWLMGDAGVSAEKEIVERLTRSAGAGKLTILKVGHHGSKTSSGEAFISFVNPDISIISCGYRNNYGHPHTEVVEKLENTGSLVLRTDLQGAIIIELKERKGISVRSWLEMKEMQCE